MYQSSFSKNVLRLEVAFEWPAKSTADIWNGKSRTPCTSSCVVKCERNGWLKSSATSPNM